jgi:hypothetical protein
MRYKLHSMLWILPGELCTWCGGLHLVLDSGAGARPAKAVLHPNLAQGGSVNVVLRRDSVTVHASRIFVRRWSRSGRPEPAGLGTAGRCLSRMLGNGVPWSAPADTRLRPEKFAGDDSWMNASPRSERGREKSMATQPRRVEAYVRVGDTCAIGDMVAGPPPGACTG